MSVNIAREINNQRNVLWNFGKQRTLLQILIAAITSIVALTVLQDFLHSQINDYSFYFSESLLYKIVWFLFLPLLFLQFRILKMSKIKIGLRVVLGVLFPIVIHLFLTPLTIWFISDVFYSHTYSFRKVFHWTMAEDFYKLPVVYGLSAIGYLYFSNKKRIEQTESTQNFREISTAKDFLEIPPKIKNPIEQIVVSSGRNYFSIAVEDILYIAAATPYISIHLENKRHLHSETLKSIGEKLDQKSFVRVHKSSIVNLKKVVSYKSRLNGDYDLLFENGDTIRLSRNYAENFKKLFNSTPQVKR